MMGKRILFIAPASFPANSAEAIVNLKQLKLLCDNGYKIDVQQLEDIKMRIISILTDDEIYASLSRNAIALSKKYSYANTIDSIEKTIIG